MKQYYPAVALYKVLGEEKSLRMFKIEYDLMKKEMSKQDIVELAKECVSSLNGVIYRVDTISMPQQS